MLLKFLNSLSPALAPINSIIKLVDLLQAIVSCVTSIPKCFLTLSPGPLIQCFEKLFEALAGIIALVPPFPYIAMVGDIAHLLRQLVDDLLSVVVIIDREVSRITAVLQEAQEAEDAILLEIGECARDNLNQQTLALYQVVALIGKLIGLILSIMEAIATLIPGAGEKVAGWAAAITGATGAVGSVSVSGFPPLGPLVQLLQLVRTILVAIEQFANAVLGRAFSFPAAITVELANP